MHRARHPSGITGLAVVNVLRTPGRSLVGAVSLAVGVTALTLLIAITLRPSAGWSPAPCWATS